MTQSCTRSWPWRKFGGGLAMICVGTFMVWHQHMLPYTLHWLDIGQTPKRTDAVFVLMGNVDTRPYVAAALYKAGLADEILLGNHQPLSPDKYVPPAHEPFRRVMLHQGVPEQDIVMLGGQATNTMSESVVLREYMDRNPTATVTIVTTHFHTRRTRWTLQQHLGPRAKRLHFVSAPNDDFDANNWWRNARGFELITMEYVKIVGYGVIYGWWGWGLLIAGLGVVGARLGSRTVRARAAK